MLSGSRGWHTYCVYACVVAQKAPTKKHAEKKKEKKYPPRVYAFGITIHTQRVVILVFYPCFVGFQAKKYNTINIKNKGEDFSIGDTIINRVRVLE